MMDFGQIEAYVQYNQTEIIDRLCDFVLHDTLLFWSEKEPLFSIQNDLWTEALNKFYAQTGINYKTTTSLKEPEENEKNRVSFGDFLKSLSIKQLTAVYLVATEVRSVIVGVCLAKGDLSAEEAFECAFMEEIFQTKKWGVTEEIAAKHENIKKTLFEVEKYGRNGSLS